MNANAMFHSPMIILTATVLAAALLLPGPAGAAVETTENLVGKMRALEAASPAERDAEVFLVDGRVWVRNRGEREFRQVEFEDPAGATAGHGVELVSSGGPMAERSASAVPSGCPVVSDGEVRGLAQACPIRFEDSAEDGAAPADQPLVDSVPDDQVVLHEHFENDFPNANWMVGDDTTNVAHNYWGRVSCKSHYGSWSLWCAGDANPVTYAPFPCTEFPADMRAYMLSAEPIDVSRHQDLELSFWLWHETWSSDPLFIWVSPGGSNWILLDVYWGTWDLQWREKRYLIEGFETLEIEVLFEADGANTGQKGVFLDDLLVSGCPLLDQASPTFPAPGATLCEGDGAWYCWDDVPGASSYVVQWDVEPSFTWPYEEVSAIGTCYHRALHGEGARWWRVSARSSCSSGQWSTPRAVTLTAQPTPPNLLAPAQGTWVCNDGFVRYEWEDTAASYTVQWDDSAGFSSPVAQQTVSNPWAWQLLSGTGIRFWRVRAENGSCDADWSSIRQVTTQPCGSIFTNGFESGSTSAWSDATP